MSPTQIVLTILFGALAGGLTNSIAIWMLFHPYDAPRFRGRHLRALQGAIPKNKARLATALGRTVGTQLLPPEDVVRALEQPGVRGAFDARLATFVAEFLEQERAPLADELPAPIAREAERLLDEVASTLLDRLDGYLAGDEFRAAARAWAEDFAAELADRPLGELLTEEREDALTAAAERWLSEAVAGPGVEQTLEDYLAGATERLLRPHRTFEEILPAGLVASFERAVAGYLPLAIERLAALLEDPGARDKVERILHEVLDRFMRDLKFHQRLVAALVITPETVDRVLRAVEAEGTEKLAELLQDPTVRDAMARGVNEAVVDFLRRPVREVLGSPEDESVLRARRTVGDWLLRLMREPQTTEFLLTKLKATLHGAERRTWGDLFRHVPPAQLADVVVGAARSGRARQLYREAAEGAIRGLFTRPIGRPADHLPENAAERLERAIAGPVWAWVLAEAPAAVEKVEIARRVEEKVLDFPPQRLEALIRGVTDRELKLIVRLGYVLGALIGLASVAINLLLS